MQTERVTFLTSRDHKAALDAYASENGKSVGHVVREATARYISQPAVAAPRDDAVIEALVSELEASLPHWNARFDSMEASMAKARHAIRDALAVVEATR